MPQLSQAPPLPLPSISRTCLRRQVASTSLARPPRWPPAASSSRIFGSRRRTFRLNREQYCRPARCRFYVSPVCAGRHAVRGSGIWWDLWTLTDRDGKYTVIRFEIASDPSKSSFMTANISASSGPYVALYLEESWHSKCRVHRSASQRTPRATNRPGDQGCSLGSRLTPQASHHSGSETPVSAGQGHAATPYRPIGGVATPPSGASAATVRPMSVTDKWLYPYYTASYNYFGNWSSDDIELADKVKYQPHRAAEPSPVTSPTNRKDSMRKARPIPTATGRLGRITVLASC